MKNRSILQAGTKNFHRRSSCWTMIGGCVSSFLGASQSFREQLNITHIITRLCPSPSSFVPHSIPASCFPRLRTSLHSRCCLSEPSRALRLAHSPALCPPRPGLLLVPCRPPSSDPACWRRRRNPFLLSRPIRLSRRHGSCGNRLVKVCLVSHCMELVSRKKVFRNCID